MSKSKKSAKSQDLRLLTTTRRLFITTQIAALCWVSTSYLIALYSTVHYGVAFPVVELSQQAITTILGVNVLKVVENVFEHNDSAVFGRSQKSSALITSQTTVINDESYVVEDMR